MLNFVDFIYILISPDLTKNNIYCHKFKQLIEFYCFFCEYHFFTHIVASKKSVGLFLHILQKHYYV
jgi:hypothetical protein